MQGLDPTLQVLTLGTGILNQYSWIDLQYMLLSGKGNVPNYIQYTLCERKKRREIT